MENSLIKNFNLPVSLCDNEGNLSFWGAFSIFGDIACEHGTDLEVGKDDLAKSNCIWVVSKTCVNFIKRPNTLKNITAKTWPTPAGKIRCNRYYTISDNEGVLVEGKSEWAVIDATTGRPQKILDIYPKDIEFLEDTVCNQPFTRFNDNFDDAKVSGIYTVKYTDIDTSNHMNNVAYIRAISGFFKELDIKQEKIKQMEISYKLQCYEGEKLTLKTKETENGIEIGIIKQDGNTAAVIAIR